MLDTCLFDSLERVGELTEAWLETYYTKRTHDGLGQMAPPYEETNRSP